MVSKVYRKTLRNHVGEHLLDAIINRELRPGDRIVEGKLARDLGVAKTTLREALTDLEHRGLVIKSSSGATYVTKLSANDIENIYSVRLLLEPEAAALAHQRLTARDYSHLATLLSKMKAAEERKDYLGASKNDMAFHQAIWKLSGNMVLARALDAVSVPMFAFSGLHLMRLFSTQDSVLTQICDEHQTLLEALKEGPAEEVRRVFIKKLQLFKSQNFKGIRLLEAGGHEVSKVKEDHESRDTAAEDSASKPV